MIQVVHHPDNGHIVSALPQILSPGAFLSLAAIDSKAIGFLDMVKVHSAPNSSEHVRWSHQDLSVSLIESITLSST
jgi:hypothetical protein